MSEQRYGSHSFVEWHSRTTSLTHHFQLAYDCLQTVPVDVEGDLKMIEELKLFLQFQSDLNYLKDGIKTHNAEPLDLLGSLDEIYQGVKNGSFKGEYIVQQSIQLLLVKAGDFHLHWFPDISQPLKFVRANGGLIAYSSDGIALPEVYYALDIGKLFRVSSSLLIANTMQERQSCSTSLHRHSRPSTAKTQLNF